MYKYVMAVTYLFQEIYRLGNNAGIKWGSHLILTACG